MEWDGLQLAANKERRCEEGERRFGTVVSRHRMSGARDGEWLSRVAGGCHRRAEAVMGGGIFARPVTVLSCRIETEMMVGEGLPLVPIS